MSLNALRQLPKDKLQKIVLVGIVTLATVVGTLQFYVLKQWQAWRAGKEQVRTLTQQIADAGQKAQQAAKNEAYRTEVTDFVTTQQAAMVAGDPFAWVVREVTLLAEKHPVRVLGLRPGTKGEAAGRPKMPTYVTRIEIAGTYDQLGEFIRDVENRFSTAEIQTLAVTGGGDAQAPLHAVFELKFLMQLDKPSQKIGEKAAS